MEQWLINTPKTIDLEVVRHVRANLMQGSLDVIAHDEPGCRVEVSTVEGRDLKVSLDGDTLLIDHPQLGWHDLGTSARALFDNPKARVSVLVPANVDVNIKATSANVLAVGIEGDVSITTVGGEHFCDGTSGKLTLTSVTGELSVRDHSGAVDAKTAAGDVTATGNITEFNGNTVSGSTVVDVAAGTPNRIANVSVSGATTVRLPAHVDPVVEVSTVTAKAQVGTRLIDALYGRTERIGTASEGSSTIKLSTVAGRLVVIRDGAAWQPAESAAPEATTEAGETAAPEQAADDSSDASPAAFGIAGNPNIDFSKAPKPTRIPDSNAEQRVAAGEAQDADQSETNDDAAQPKLPPHQPFEPGNIQTAGGTE